MAGTSLGAVPMRRYALPSIRIKLKSGCSRRVQCRVVSSVNRAAMDHMLGYGLFATSGTAGGRKAGESPGGSAWAEAVVSITAAILTMNCLLNLFMPFRLTSDYLNGALSS